MEKQFEVVQSEQSCVIGEQTVRGRVYRADRDGRLPLVICSHGFAGTFATVEPYAQAVAAQGLAAYAYDFRGGSAQSTSDGDTTEMSVMTEVGDLEAVMSAAADWPFVDSSRMVLLGASQGGYVSAVAAARQPAAVTALILLYPAFVAGDDMHKAFSSLSDVPERLFYRNRLEVGRKYFTDLWDYDPYEEMGRFRGPVLIIHGTADKVVPLSYSERAREVYGDAELKVVAGGGHGFQGADRSQAIADVISFLRSVHILPTEGR